MRHWSRLGRPPSCLTLCAPLSACVPLCLLVRPFVCLGAPLSACPALQNASCELEFKSQGLAHSDDPSFGEEQQ